MDKLFVKTLAESDWSKINDFSNMTMEKLMFTQWAKCRCGGDMVKTKETLNVANNPSYKYKCNKCGRVEYRGH